MSRRSYVGDFLVEMKKLSAKDRSTVSYLLVAGAPNESAAMQIAARYANLFGLPVSARPTDPQEPEPPITMYIAREK
jgi:hypothetical protein